MDLSTRTIGTDAEQIRFHPRYLMTEYLEHPRRLSRCYLHILMHCLFRHMFVRRQFADEALFDLCADIAAEALVDSIDAPEVAEIPSELRESWYRRLREEVQVLTAEKLYRWFDEQPRDFLLEEALAREFLRDDHSFWSRMNKEQKAPQPPEPESAQKQLASDWKDRAKSTQKLLAGAGSDPSSERGSLAWTLSFADENKTDYRDFLRRFAAVREEVRVDPDGFDYAYYHYGMELYGDMPLIEENEFRETVGIDELVIAIDTSGSTRAQHVQRFLNETAAMLAAQETFLHHVHIRLIECDDRIQRDLLLTDVREIGRYADAFEVSGGMGTDFRPVFRHVRELRRSGALPHLRGLLYFTDGYGVFPETPPGCDTAFVFWADAPYNDRDVPGWAMKLFFHDLPGSDQ